MKILFFVAFSCTLSIHVSCAGARLPRVNSQLNIFPPQKVCYTPSFYIQLLEEYRKNNGLPEKTYPKAPDHETMENLSKIFGGDQEFVIDVSWPSMKKVFTRIQGNQPQEDVRAKLFEKVIEYTKSFDSEEKFLPSAVIVADLVNLCFSGPNSLFDCSNLPEHDQNILESECTREIMSDYTFFQRIMSLLAASFINAGKDAFVDHFSRIKIAKQLETRVGNIIRESCYHPEFRTIVINEDTWISSRLYDTFIFTLLHESTHAYHDMIFPNYDSFRREPLLANVSFLENFANSKLARLVYPMFEKKTMDPVVEEIERAIPDDVFELLVKSFEKKHPFVEENTYKFVSHMFTLLLDWGLGHLFLPERYFGEPLHTVLTKRMLAKALYVFLQGTSGPLGSEKLCSEHGEEMLTMYGACIAVAEGEKQFGQGKDSATQAYTLLDKQNERVYCVRVRNSGQNDEFYSDKLWRTHISLRTSIPEQAHRLFGNDAAVITQIEESLKTFSKRPAPFLFHFYNADEAVAQLANPNEKISGKAPLHAAIDEDYVEMVEALLKRQDVDIHLQNEEGQDPLFSAITQGKLEVVKAFVNSERINIDAKIEKSELTPLLLAIKLGNVELVRLLLEHEANPNLEDGALHAAMDCIKTQKHLSEHAKIIRLLLEINAVNLCIPDKYNKIAPLEKVLTDLCLHWDQDSYNLCSAFSFYVFDSF
ncbi:MAG: ankyrin repeat domain-containing protein, partial [Holosporales bacterium]|nr:ankyrin repeat domain-containing protein [Holosporales bacterium]